jgi:outer membrane receptor protein involved in Fe transport
VTNFCARSILPYHRQTLRPWVLVLALCGLPLPVTAMPGDDLLDLSMEELLQVKITTSTLQDENLASVPSSLTVYTRADIRRLGLQNLTELVNLVPGLQGSRVDDGTLNFSLSSRGRRSSAAWREILVLVDGQRINNEWNGGAGQHTNLIPIEHVDRVEFIRGPGSALYGSNAMMGVINIITRSERELVAEAGTDDHTHVSAQWRQDGDAGAVELYARDTRSGGENLRLFEPSPNPATPEWVNSSDPFRANDLYLRGHLGAFSASLMGTSLDTEKYYVAGYVDETGNYRDTRTQLANVGWKQDLAFDLTLQGQIFFAERDLAIRAAPSLVPYLILEGSTDERERGTQWIVQGKLAQSRWLLGWEWRNPELRDTSYQIGTPLNPVMIQAQQAPEEGRIIRGWFGQFQHKIVDNLELTAGLRRDDYSDVGDHLSPRLGLVWQAGQRDTLKLLYSEAFRAPSPIEMHVISPEFQASPDLKPETANTVEVIWLHFFDRGYVSTTLFDARIDAAIVEKVTPLLRRTWVNSNLSMSGLELEWQMRWTRRWQSRLALTQLHHLDDATSDESDSLLSGSVSYEYQAWTASLFANYQGPKRDSNEQDFPADITTLEYTDFGGRTLVGAHLAWRMTDALELYSHADNLFDKQYYSPANRAPNYVGAPGTGRLLTLGMRWQLP